MADVIRCRRCDRVILGDERQGKICSDCFWWLRRHTPRGGRRPKAKPKRPVKK